MRLLAALLLLATAAAAGVAEARQGRRARVRELIGSGYALVLGQPVTDVIQPPQEGHFHYLTGVDDQGALLLLAGKKAPPLPFGETRVGEALFLRGSNERFARFYGPRHRPDPASIAALGVETVQPAPRGTRKIAALLATLLPRAAKLHVPAYRGSDRAFVREVRANLLRELRIFRPELEIVDLDPALASMRSVKDELEIAAIRRAIDMTVEAFREALPEIRPGSWESAVDGALLRAIRRRNGRPAYTFVVAAGANSTIPHYFRNDHPLRSGDLLLIDAGASVDRYAADLSRTFPISGKFTKRQREVYELVLRAQRAGIAAVKPGAKFAEVDAAARAVIRAAGLDKHFIHFVGHHVGLDVHDPSAALLRTGMTITVEPGVYLPGEGFGIRIEDVVIVTEQGGEVLSSALPKEPDEIEALFR